MDEAYKDEPMENDDGVVAGNNPLEQFDIKYIIDSVINQNGKHEQAAAASPIH